MKKKQIKKLELAKETLRDLVVGGLLNSNDKSVYWSCVPQDSGMYTCEC
jgi:hypothetical protein